MYFPVYIIKVLSAFCIFFKPLKSSFSLDLHVYFIFSNLIFALMVAIIICYSNTPCCFFFGLSFCCNLCRYSFQANLLNISYKILALPIMQMGKFCSRYVRSFDLNHYSYISLPCNTSFSSFQGILLIRTLVRHVLKIETYKTQVMYICISWLKSELRCPGKFLCSISGSSASRSSHLVFIVENRLYNK